MLKTDGSGITRQMGFIQSGRGINRLLQFRSEVVEGVGSKGSRACGMMTKRYGIKLVSSNTE